MLYLLHSYGIITPVFCAPIITKGSNLNFCGFMFLYSQGWWRQSRDLVLIWYIPDLLGFWVVHFLKLTMSYFVFCEMHQLPPKHMSLLSLNLAPI